jgi:glycine hydroxymethyltransferase
LAPEAPTSPTVRRLLSAEVGTRAAEGHIGQLQRWFTGTKHIDEIEALTVELLKRLYAANYADHRLCASMIGNAAVYTALTEPGDVIMGRPALRRPQQPEDGRRARAASRSSTPFDPAN